MNKYPKVVLVGRMNVGKSTLFNRLSEKVKSITLDYEGVTRDFLSDVISWQGVNFELVDSGGISTKKFQDPLTEKVRQLALKLVEEADLILFVVDGKIGVTAEDLEVNSLLRKLNKKVLLVVNKSDAQATEEHRYEFNRFGYKDSYFISALHGKGIGDLLEAIVENVRDIPQKERKEEPVFRITLLGKPNVGKSSLMNILLEEERSLVSEEAGTTREAITEPIRFYKQTLQLTDTPGVRRKRGVKETLETMMVKTAFRAVEKSDIVLLLVDGSEGKLSDQELKLAFYAFEKEFKALIILINKEDLIDDFAEQDLKRAMEFYEFFLKKIPILHISCKTGKNLGKILPLIEKVQQRYVIQFSDEELTMLFKDALKRKPLYVQNVQLNFKKAKQIKSGPPTIVFFVQHPQFWGQSQISYLENVLRAQINLEGVPVKFIPRKG